MVQLFEKHDMHQEGGKVAHARGKEVSTVRNPQRDEATKGE
jgi:hypothetical protein